VRVQFALCNRASRELARQINRHGLGLAGFYRGLQAMRDEPTSISDAKGQLGKAPLCDIQPTNKGTVATLADQVFSFFQASPMTTKTTATDRLKTKQKVNGGRLTKTEKN